MTSRTSTYSARSTLAHKLHTVTSNSVNPAYYERVVSPGQNVVPTFKVASYRMVDATRHTLYVQEVSSYQEYMAGCTTHGERCLGHLCKTPRGTILLPQKMASSMGVMSNDYAKMAEAVFNRDTASQELTYREKLKKTMLGKSGAMRGNMPAGPVDSSGREVITNCWELEVMSQNDKDDTIYFAIPRAVANNMRVVKVGVDAETGLPTSTYVEDYIREGDYVIVVRPPSLWHGNVQPMKVVVWNRECFGLAPSLCEDYHADFDGDEMQIFFIGTPEAIEECKRWNRLTPNKFKHAVETMRLPKDIHKGEENIITRFMEHSTMSMKELMDGRKLPAISKAARIKEPMVDMLVQRLRNPYKVFTDYAKESRRGKLDVMNQQLFQGIVGDMLRQASLAASCIKYKGNGIFDIMIGCSTVTQVDTAINYPIRSIAYPLGGNSCMRAIRTICAKAQQAALDSHRVSTSAKPKLDMIKNMISGSDTTCVVLTKGRAPDAEFVYVNKSEDDAIYCVADVDDIKPLARRIIAAYHPTLLRAVELVGGDKLEVCKKGIAMVCNYYEISIDDLELTSAAILLSYGKSSTGDAATTKRGMLKRSMRWLVTVFANHFAQTKAVYTQGITDKFVAPQTATEASAFCNFDHLI